MFGITPRGEAAALDLLAAWIPTISGAATHWDPSTDEACEDLVRWLVDPDPQHVEAALGRFGRQLGQHGWLLQEITGWIGELSRIAGPYRRRLSRFSAGIALAKGWAEGAQHEVETDSCTDPVTGLVTLPVLHLRLTQAYDHCRALGTSAAEMYCLVVIDTLLGELHLFERDAVRAVVAELVAASFRSGETIAHHDGRILVLATSDERIRGQLLDLIVAFDASPLLDPCSPVCWIERLPTSLREIDRYLFELTPTTL